MKKQLNYSQNYYPMPSQPKLHITEGGCFFCNMVDIFYLNLRGEFLLGGAAAMPFLLNGLIWVESKWIGIKWFGSI